jgi:hypothetical protein
MSLQPGINPLDRRMQPGLRTMEVRDQHYSFPSAEELSKKMDARQRVAERTRTAMEFRDNMARGIPNMGGFDPGDLMAAPKLRQDATMNQANMVSSPYFEANEKAAEKTNPMNAASQEPGRSFLMKYIGK